MNKKDIEFILKEEEESEIWVKFIFSDLFIRKNRKKIGELEISGKLEWPEAFNRIYSDIKCADVPILFEEKGNSINWKSFTTKMISIEILHLILTQKIKLTKENDIYSIGNTKLSTKITNYFLEKQTNEIAGNWIQEGIYNSFIRKGKLEKLKLSSFLNKVVTYCLGEGDDNLPYREIALNLITELEKKVKWISIDFKIEKKMLIFEEKTFEISIVDRPKLLELLQDIEFFIEKPFRETRETANFRLDLMKSVSNEINKLIPTD